jgi:hypothetical protein
MSSEPNDSVIPPTPSRDSAREVFRAYLLPDEDVLWFGQPDPKILFTPDDLFLIPFSLLWGGFAIAWEIGVIAALASGQERSGNGGYLWQFAVFGLIFVAAGLYLIIGRHIFKRIWKKRTYYGVTSRKVIAVTRLRRESAKAAFIEDISSLNKRVRKDGAGTITFGNVPGRFKAYTNTGLDFFAGAKARDSMPVAFYDVQRVDDVYRIVDELRSK